MGQAVEWRRKGAREKFNKTISNGGKGARQSAGEVL